MISIYVDQIWTLAEGHIKGVTTMWVAEVTLSDQSKKAEVNVAESINVTMEEG